MRKRAAYVAFLATIAFPLVAFQTVEAKESVAMVPTKEPVKVVADSMYYSDKSGNLEATGNVEIFQGKREIYTDAITGNIQTEQYQAVGSVRMKEGMDKDLHGEGLVYDGKARVAKFSKVEGLQDPIYLKGEEGLFENNVGIVKKGMVTTPSAMAWVHTPDYRIEGEDIQVYPGDKAVVKNAKLYIKNWKVLSLPSYTTSLKRGAGKGSIISFVPRPTYSSDNGLGLHGDFAYPIGKNTDFVMDYYLYSKEGFKPSVGIEQYMSWGKASFGYYETEGTIDNKSIWIKKSPEFALHTNKISLGNTGLHVRAGGTLGHWEEGSTEGNHKMCYGELGHAPIKISKDGKISFFAGYQRDYYGVNKSTRSMPYWGGRLSYEFFDKLHAYVAYREQKNGNESPYQFDRYDIRKKGTYGFVYTIDRLNGIGVEVAQDWETGKIKDVDYTYYRDLHSFKAEITYREKKNDWRFKIRAKDF